MTLCSISCRTTIVFSFSNPFHSRWTINAIDGNLDLSTINFCIHLDFRGMGFLLRPVHVGTNHQYIVEQLNNLLLTWFLCASTSSSTRTTHANIVQNHSMASKIAIRQDRSLKGLRLGWGCMM